MKKEFSHVIKSFFLMKNIKNKIILIDDSIVE